MATLKDVAKLANVDVSTVSRALNNTSYVHPDTKKKIFKAVEQLSYRPNLLAKGLKQGKRRTLGVVVPSVNLSLFGEIVQGIEMQAGNRGYSLMICMTKDDPDIEAECLNRLRNGRKLAWRLQLLPQSCPCICQRHGGRIWSGHGSL